jgi:hypothetical protein
VSDSLFSLVRVGAPGRIRTCERGELNLYLAMIPDGTMPTGKTYTTHPGSRLTKAGPQANAGSLVSAPRAQSSPVTRPEHGVERAVGGAAYLRAATVHHFRLVLPDARAEADPAQARLARSDPANSVRLPSLVFLHPCPRPSAVVPLLRASEPSAAIPTGRQGIP